MSQLLFAVINKTMTIHVLFKDVNGCLFLFFLFFFQFSKVHFRRSGAQLRNPVLQTNLFIENNLFTSLQHVFMPYALGQDVA